MIYTVWIVCVVDWETMLLLLHAILYILGWCECVRHSFGIGYNMKCSSEIDKTPTKFSFCECYQKSNQFFFFLDWAHEIKSHHLTTHSAWMSCVTLIMVLTGNEMLVWHSINHAPAITSFYLTHRDQNTENKYMYARQSDTLSYDEWR